MTILVALTFPDVIYATNEAKTSESPRRTAGSLTGETLKLGYLFLIRGLILLAAAAGLLRPLAGFIRHLVGLAGLVALLRWIRLILLCHFSSPGYQRRLLPARANVY